MEYPDYRDPNHESSYMRQQPDYQTQRSRTSYSLSHNPSISASTRSWVQHGQYNPPATEETPTSYHVPRPLPEPHQYQQQQQQYQQQQHQQQYFRTPTQYTENLDDEDEYMNIDADGPGMDTGYQNEGLGKGRRQNVEEQYPDLESTPERPPKKGFVGGFVSGLKRLPRSIFRYGSSDKKKRKMTTPLVLDSPQPGAMVPQYALNQPPPIAEETPRVSEDQYEEQASEMPVPHVDQSYPAQNSQPFPPTTSYRRRHPSFRIIPPSDSVQEEDEHDLEREEREYQERQHGTAPNSGRNTPHSHSHHHGDEDDDDDHNNNNTTSVYIYPQDTGGRSQTPVPQTPVYPLTIPSRSHTPSQRTPIAGQQIPTVQRTSTPPPTIIQPPIRQDTSGSAALRTGERSSPVVAHPLPSDDYLKMSLSPAHRHTQATSFSTSVMSTSGPSFASELNPLSRFFHYIVTLPWIAKERVTVDYRPGPGRNGKMSAKGTTKKPMSSWYRFEKGNHHGQRHLNAAQSNQKRKHRSHDHGEGDGDLLSPGQSDSRPLSGATETTGTVALSPITRSSHATSRRTRKREVERSPAGSGATRRRREKERERSASSKHQHHRRRNTLSSSLDAQVMLQQPPVPPLPLSLQQQQQPMVNGVATSPVMALYQYPYPYPYPYTAYPTPPQQSPPQPHRTVRGSGERSSSRHHRDRETREREHREHRDHHHHTGRSAPTYPHGYVPYQPLPPPPIPQPVYVIQSQGHPLPSSMARSGSGGQVNGISSQQSGQLLSPVYVPMQMVPGGFMPPQPPPQQQQHPGGTLLAPHNPQQQSSSSHHGHSHSHHSHEHHGNANGYDYGGTSPGGVRLASVQGP